jgi:heme oxygenase
MPSASRVLLRVNMETRALHPEADWPWLELMSLEASRARYIDHLVGIYGFEAPVEAALNLTPYMAEVIPLRPRSRSGLIVEDLLSLGLTASKIARLPQCRSIAPFRDPAEAFGWLYVVERATLLHDTVRSYMEPRMPNVHAWRYLSAYKGVASLHWQDLGRAFDAYAITNASVEHMIAAARTAFVTQRDWLASKPAQSARKTWDADLSGRFALE